MNRGGGFGAARAFVGPYRWTGGRQGTRRGAGEPRCFVVIIMKGSGTAWLCYRFRDFHD